ncbi:hypothetical protein QJS04_geneDACA018841 [Acorus gramineus]|uniref:Uncharacterized protein n=1 Tax=Acorus gramineus TaxID=55184 RepID=A0AAV9BMP3_ACOGR|nr:hypothetical protein QJS04_geneDACA018841 [Acorus gramineus]
MSHIHFQGNNELLASHYIRELQPHIQGTRNWMDLMMVTQESKQALTVDRERSLRMHELGRTVSTTNGGTSLQDKNCST